LHDPTYELQDVRETLLTHCNLLLQTEATAQHANPEEVECVAREALTCNVLRQMFYNARLLLHTTKQQLSMSCQATHCVKVNAGGHGPLCSNSTPGQRVVQ